MEKSNPEMIPKDVIGSGGPPGSRLNYERDLNPAQLDAVFFDQGPLLVIAGAGSGKTRTLTYRVARLVEEQVSPASILLLTFTRRASQEMLRRAALLIDERCRRVAGGTFHSFAYLILRKYASHLRLDPDFTILDRDDSENLIGMLRKEINLPAKSGAFPRKQTLTNIFSKTVNKMVGIEDVIAGDYPHLVSYLEAICQIYHAYTVRKIEHQFLDYDDLLIYLLRLLADHPMIAQRLSSSYRYIMVDEYQDTNRIQADILYHLAGSHHNLMVVGDDSQSIYAFRGANFKNIMEFPQRFPGARVIALEENYRSTQPILDLTNAVIRRAKEKYTKNLFTRRGGGARPIMIEAEDEAAQSRCVVARIQNLQREGVALDDICVLFRAGFHSFDLEIELSRIGIPFIKVGGFKFVESAHIKDVLAHLRVMTNPVDRISWYRILLLLEQVGAKTARNIYEAVVAEKAGYTGLLTAKLSLRKSESLERLKSLFAYLDSRRMSVAEMGAAVIAYYTPILQNRFDDHPKRTKDLDQLLEIMERYQDIKQFLADMALEPPNTNLDDTFAVDPSEQRRLVLSTIHSAKGLEWHSVFIIWVLDGRFPSVHAFDKEEELEEELRLLYVAATRARQNLYFTFPNYIFDRSTGMVFRRPCRFLAGIPDEILDRQFYVD
jgi:DNA helicase-2/ATP-dependent DNA helicase PcrA